MKKAIMNKWVKALRSKKYRQTRECLLDEKGYCCLGVLSEISKLGRFDANGNYITSKGSSSEDLTEDITDWAGMYSRSGYFRPEDEQYDADGIVLGESLAGLNDSGWSFRKLATYIEKNYRRL